ncbi:hypothetical protein H4W34_001689 [Actinomadura algeriensis]|uniref:Uncharacterized protein n=1 Tax=Actinomadura algeriensis TaxID=1679523 RepID=A0ABR9JNC8_9ACTN|nr:hypothetical protein [Actinomadura algeriensis]
MLMNAMATAWWPLPIRAYRPRPADVSGRDAIGG